MLRAKYFALVHLGGTIGKPNPHYALKVTNISIKAYLGLMKSLSILESSLIYLKIKSRELEMMSFYFEFIQV